MGTPLSVIAVLVPSVVSVAWALVKMFDSKPERENATVTEVRDRLNQPRRITEAGEDSDSEGGGDSDEPNPSPVGVAKIMESINTYLQTSVAGGHKLSPTVWPTEKEFNDAKERFCYTPGNLHFAVTGIAGSGKSTLVNSLRGLRASDPDAARIGVNETTTETGLYPHPDKESPLARVMWYDIPGAGTQTTPGGSEYFNAQGLFIFDFIIVATGDRFTEQDLDILANCKMYNIPSFVVRSKSDIHIRNMASDGDFSFDDARMIYTDTTRTRFKEEIKVAANNVDLDCNKEIFLVSKEPLRDFVRSLMDGKAPRSPEALIDEHPLVMKILLAAQMRRYPSKYGAGWALLKVQNLRAGY